jgi:hypothetical protein
MNCWKTRAIVLLFAICGSTVGLHASDLDGDGILDGNDVCCNTPQGTAVDATGRPIGDLDQDCDVDLLDFALLAANLTGPLAPPSCPSCFDQQQNGSETDLDCGGGICAPCASGFECLSASDCESRVCVAGVCQPPTCSDSVRNGFETGVDCGGNCLACPDGEGCDTGIDCVSLVCVNEECQPATCSDSVRNGFETGIDCGGTVCLACPDGEGCDTGSDCASLVCTSQVCQVPTCQDGVQNGSEQGVDCGGPCSPCGQPNGAPCGMPSQCSSNFCVDGRCCNSPCDGTCEACDLPGASGVCSLISAGEDPITSAMGSKCAMAAEFASRIWALPAARRLPVPAVSASTTFAAIRSATERARPATCRVLWACAISSRTAKTPTTNAGFRSTTATVRAVAVSTTDLPPAFKHDRDR